MLSGRKERLLLGAVALAVVIARGPWLASRVLSNVGLIALARYRQESRSPASSSLTTAQTWLQRSLRLDAHNTSAHRGLGWVHSFRSEWQAARTEWRRAGWSQVDLLELANRELDGGDPWRAVRYLAVGRRMKGSLDSAYAYCESRAQAAMGQTAQADELLELAVDTDRGWSSPSTQWKAWLEWAEALLERNQSADAQRAADRSIELCLQAEPGSSECWKTYRTLGHALVAQMDYDRAVIRLEEAVGRFPAEPWLRVRYGQALYLRRPVDVIAAEEELLKAVTLLNGPDMWKTIVQFWSVHGESDRVDDWCGRAAVSGQGQSVAEYCGAK